MTNPLPRTFAPMFTRIRNRRQQKHFWKKQCFQIFHGSMKRTDMSSPRSETMVRDDKPCLHITSSVCDIAGIICAIPCVALTPLEGCCANVFDFASYTPQQPPTRAGIFDRWYRASIFTFNGGSMLQLLSTQPVFWRFPVREQKNGYVLHDIEVSPANACGSCCLAPVIRASQPQFRIRKMPSGAYSVRLNAKAFGCCWRECSAYELNDVWRVQSGGDVITSMKTRGFAKCCVAGDGDQDYCVTLPSPGPAMFISVDPMGPTLRDLDESLLSDH